MSLATFATQLNYLIEKDMLKKHHVIKLKNYTINMVQDKRYLDEIAIIGRVLIVLEIELVHNPGAVIGKPTNVDNPVIVNVTDRFYKKLGKSSARTDTRYKGPSTTGSA